jgi:hypothetical protein
MSFDIILVMLVTNSFIDRVIVVLDSLSSNRTLLGIQEVLSEWFKMLIKSYPVTEPNIAFVRSQVSYLNSLPYIDPKSLSGASTRQPC